MATSAVALSYLRWDASGLQWRHDCLVPAEEAVGIPLTDN